MSEQQIEIWKPVPEFEGIYLVSNQGNYKSIDRVSHHPLYGDMYLKGKIISKHNHSKGYDVVTLTKNGKSKRYFAHLFVAQCFVPNPDNKPYIDHIDGNKKNNVYTNLRWVTAKENSNNPITLEKLRNAVKTEDYRKQVSNRMKNRVFSEEHRRKLSMSKKGVTMTEEQKKKISQALKEFHNNK